MTEHFLIVCVEDATPDAMYVTSIRNYLSAFAPCELLTKAEHAALVQALEMTLGMMQGTSDRFSRSDDPDIRAQGQAYEPFIDALHEVCRKMGDPFISQVPDSPESLVKGEGI